MPEEFKFCQIGMIISSIMKDNIILLTYQLRPKKAFLSFPVLNVAGFSFQPIYIYIYIYIYR